MTNLLAEIYQIACVCPNMELEGKAKTRPDILRVVLGPYVQNCPCETSEEKTGAKTKIWTKENRA